MLEGIERRIEEGRECSRDVEQLVSEFLEQVSRQGFRHDIRQHLESGFIKHLNIPSLDPVRDKKITNVYMSCPFTVRLTIFK